MTSDKPDHDDEFTRGFTELSQSMFDDGSRVVTASYTPKEVAPVNTQKRLSKRVLWAIAIIIAASLAGIAFALTLSAFQAA